MAARNYSRFAVALAVIANTLFVDSSLEIQRCMLACDFGDGYMLAPTGCRCVRVNRTTILSPCPHAMCAPTPCQVFKKDANGCLTCDCQCQPPVCPTAGCSAGVEFYDDAMGCPNCRCKPDCGQPACDMVCPNGLAVDRFGCERCMCAELPAM